MNLADVLKEWLPLTVGLASAIASIFMWRAKFIWSKEFEKAKNETIKAKEEQIATFQHSLDSLEKAKDDKIAVLEAAIQRLEALTPQILHESVEYARQRLESYIEALKEDLGNREAEIATLKLEGSMRQSEVQEKSEEIKRLNQNLEQVQQKADAVDEIRASATRESAALVSDLLNFVRDTEEDTLSSLYWQNNTAATDLKVKLHPNADLAETTSNRIKVLKTLTKKSPGWMTSFSIGKEAALPIDTVNNLLALLVKEKRVETLESTEDPSLKIYRIRQRTTIAP